MARVVATQQGLTPSAASASVIGPWASAVIAIGLRKLRGAGDRAGIDQAQSPGRDHVADGETGSDVGATGAHENDRTRLELTEVPGRTRSGRREPDAGDPRGDALPAHGRALMRVAERDRESGELGLESREDEDVGVTRSGDCS